jgi:hypothetical protein
MSTAGRHHQAFNYNKKPPPSTKTTTDDGEEYARTIK